MMKWGIIMSKQNKEKNFYKFTTSFISLLLGIIFILVSIIADTTFISSMQDKSLWKIVCSILSKVLSAVGVSLVVGFITGRIHNEEVKHSKQEDLDSFKSAVEDIIISKSFLESLPDSQKKGIVKECLLGETKEHQMVRYIDHKIDCLQGLNTTQVRSNIDYITTISICENRVKARTEMSYRIYRNNGSYSAIRHNFSDKNGKIISMAFTPSHGKQFNVPKKYLETKEERQYHGNEVIYTNKVYVPEKLLNEESLTVSITVEEYGNDHWIHLTWMSLYPTDIISYKVICKDGLIIKEHSLFDERENLYLVKLSEDKTNISIKCDKWTDPYTGFSLVVSKP